MLQCFIPTHGESSSVNSSRVDLVIDVTNKIILFEGAVFSHSWTGLYEITSCSVCKYSLLYFWMSERDVFLRIIELTCISLPKQLKTAGVNENQTLWALIRQSGSEASHQPATDQ